MLKKNKIIIGVSITCAIILTLGLIIGGLNRLDIEKYGLNYNHITANFSNSDVYDGGLYLIGPANVLLEIPRTQQTIYFSNIQTYTKDFFPLVFSASIVYSLQIPPTNQNYSGFKALSNFYTHFGSNPNQIIEPIAKNQLIKALSHYNSYNYQNANISLYQQQIANSITTMLNKWTNITIDITISSLVCKGISRSTETYTRQINGLKTQLKRMKNRKIDLSLFTQKYLSSLQLKMDIIKKAISQQKANIQSISTSCEALQIIQTTANNLEYASSQLQLRPQLYNIKVNYQF